LLGSVRRNGGRGSFGGFLLGLREFAISRKNLITAKRV